MLTGKNYCDYDTCVALKELGFDEYCRGFFDPLCKIFNETSYLRGWNNTEGSDCGVLSCPSLYEAQKWLREEKGLFVNVELFGDYDRDADGKTLGTWVYYSYGILNTTTADFIREYDLCTEYQTYEEALLEGVRQAVKILKEK